MYIKRAEFKNFTVFEDVEFEFAKGINIFIGENGTGKTHAMKVLYSACQAARTEISFSNKIVRTMLPDDYKISRLVSKNCGNSAANVKITAVSDDVKETDMNVSFNKETKKWDALVEGEEKWEREFSGISSVYIPAKEILSHSYKLPAAVAMNNVMFDDTYIDIINSSQIDMTSGRSGGSKAAMLRRIEEITEGKVVYDGQRDEFYLEVGGSAQEFNLVAEGIRKMAMLWQLIKNGTLENGSVLFWDEPEANMNPTYMPVIVELLLELHRNGVQLFISTHNYILAKYFEVRKRKEDDVLFHSLAKSDGIVYENNRRFSELKNNSVISSFNALLDEIYDMED